MEFRLGRLQHASEYNQSVHFDQACVLHRQIRIQTDFCSSIQFVVLNCVSPHVLSEATAATALSELGFRFLLFKHGFRHHSTLNLPRRCLGHIIGQEDLQLLSFRGNLREREQRITPVSEP